MIYIAICDDNKKTAEILRNKVIAYIRANDLLVDIKLYTKSTLLQYDVQEGAYFDLILSDIEMPEINGMKLVSNIKKYLSEVYIIFITSHEKYAIDAYELSIFRYISKNNLSNKLPQALNDVFKMIRVQSEECYLINTTRRIEKIPYRKIMCIQREGKNSVLTLLDGAVVKVRKSLVHVYEELNSEDFVYVDRGNIINLVHVMGIKKENIEMKNGSIFSVSHSKLEQIKEQLTRFWGEHI